VALTINRFPGEAVRIGQRLILRVLGFTHCGVTAQLEFDGRQVPLVGRLDGAPISISEDVTVAFYTVLSKGCLRLGITAPPSVRILRCELEPHTDRAI
jgi:sRNA-binding carbon storage regulator CsrA